MGQYRWKDVRSLIRQKILDSTYAPGDKLPKDEEIAEELGCSRTTVQRAMRELSVSGLVVRKRKGGTCVRSDPITRATLDIPIIRKEVEKKGSLYSYHLINREFAFAPIAIYAHFGITIPEKMLHVEALHLADSRPYIYEDRWIYTQTVPEILDVDLGQNSANEWLVRNKPYSRCDIRFYAERAGKYYSNLLNAGLNDGLFIIERTTWLGSKPITSVKAVTTPDYQMLVQIKADANAGTEFAL